MYMHVVCAITASSKLAIFRRLQPSLHFHSFFCFPFALRHEACQEHTHAFVTSIESVWGMTCWLTDQSSCCWSTGENRGSTANCYNELIHVLFELVFTLTVLFLCISHQQCLQSKHWLCLVEKRSWFVGSFQIPFTQWEIWSGRWSD